MCQHSAWCFKIQLKYIMYSWRFSLILPLQKHMLSALSSQHLEYSSAYPFGL